MNITEAMDKISTDRSLAAQFSTEPERVLVQLGVNTTKLKIRRADPALSQVTVCLSAGAVVCASAGWDVGMATESVGPAGDSK
jgi:hypothetical protein